MYPYRYAIGETNKMQKLLHKGAFRENKKEKQDESLRTFNIEGCFSLSVNHFSD